MDGRTKKEEIWRVTPALDLGGPFRTVSTRQAREEVGSSYVWCESNVHLRHGKLGVFRGDYKVSVDGDARTAAHCDAVDERHVRLREGVDEVIELIFVSKEVLLEGRLVLAGLVDGADVTASTKGLGIVRLENNNADLAITVPFLVSGSDGVDHVQIEGVERLRAVECKQTQATFVVRNHLLRSVRGVCGHEHRKEDQKSQHTLSCQSRRYAFYLLLNL